uniref:Uncharacterized protein n=1 Tax=Arundo donax TaxID=35708 RepID=A0A0A9BAY1_ARUDO
MVGGQHRRRETARRPWRHCTSLKQRCGGSKLFPGNPIYLHLRGV